MVSRDAVLDALRAVNDPEMPVNIVDLGLVGDVREEGGRVTVDLLPTFVGCHAWPVIEEEVRRQVAALPGVSAVEVRTRFDPPWTVERISLAGREALRHFGITVPEGADDSPRCPFCASADVRLESPFGPTRCKMIYHCAACRNPFEHLKRVGRSLLQVGLSKSAHGGS